MAKRVQWAYQGAAAAALAAAATCVCVLLRVLLHKAPRGDAKPVPAAAKAGIGSDK